MSEPHLQRTSDPCLLSKPQRFGILPTWRFWTGHNWRLVRWPAAFVAMSLALLFAESGVPIYLAGLLPAVTFIVAFGLFERYIRHRAIQRRSARAGDTAGSGKLAVGEAGPDGSDGHYE